MTKTLSPKEYAARLGTSRHKIFRWIRDGRIRAINVVADPDTSPPRWRIPVEEIERFERSRSSMEVAS